jgi:hypothetical protein
MVFALGEQFLPVTSESVRPFDLEFCFLFLEFMGFPFQKIDALVSMSIDKAIIMPKLLERE